MNRRSVVLLLVLAVLAIPSIAQAQSSVSGVVKDTSGGVLPGVLIEAASPAIIEGTKSATTDESGQYRIIDLRPGVYTVTFTLAGFQTTKVEKIELQSEVTRTVNAELKLGSVSESLTVSGVAATVDVQNATRVTTLDRQVLDNLPTGQNIWEMAVVIPGINLTSPQVGGQGGATQTYMTVHGMSSAQNVVLVDGMTVSGLEANGSVQAYFNPDMNAEVSYQTSGISADRSGGGVTVNMIPREGGNRFSGNGRINYRPNAWIGDNFSTRLQDMGLEFIGTLDYLADETISQGGPIIRNKLWFFGSYHQFNTSDFISQAILDDGSQAHDDQEINQGSVRITWQASARNKVSGSYEKTSKTRSGAAGALTDWETASVPWTSPNYSTGNIKLTSTITSKLLFEGGFSFNREYRDTVAQDGIMRERGTPEWYANVSTITNDTGNAPRSFAPSSIGQDWPARNNYQGSVTYVTGAHQIKAGGSIQTGRFFHSNDTNGDLTRRFDRYERVDNNYIYYDPVDVIIRNSPVSSIDRLNADMGFYAQDSWRIKRLTVNAGLRWEHINAQNDAHTAPEGRFAPARSIAAVTNTPDWYDWAPRFSAVYDLFGDSRTALKYAINRYNRATGTALAFGFNTLTLTATPTLPWLDGNGDKIPQGDRSFTYNPDGSLKAATNCHAPIPTGGTFADVAIPGVCEINMTNLSPTFGLPAANDSYLGFPRTWNLEQLIEVQHALTRRLSITGSFTRGSDRDLTKTVNPMIQAGDFIPYTIYNPIDGTPITLWGLKDAATRTRVGPTTGNPNNFAYVEPINKSTYYSYGLEFRMRPYAGAQIFGGLSLEREDSVDCASSIPGVLLDPNNFRFCDDYNLSGIDDNNQFEQEVGIIDSGGRTPFAKDFRLGVSLPLPWYGISLGVTYLNNDLGSTTPTYSTITPGTTVYPNGAATPTRRIVGDPAPPCPTEFGCVPGGVVLPSTYLPRSGATTASVNLVPGGRIRDERLNQLDLQFSKTFRVKNVSILPTFNIYNTFNQDLITGISSDSYANTTGTYLVPDDILQSRIMGIGLQVRW